MQGLYRTILVPLDGSSFSQRALPTATALARATGAGLVLVRLPAHRFRPACIRPTYRAGRFKKKTFTSPPTSGAGLPAAQIRAVEEAELYLNGIAYRLAEQGLQVEAAVPYAAAAEGDPDRDRRAKAPTWSSCDDGRSGLGRWIFGSVAEEVLVTALCLSCWCVRPGRP